MGKIEIQLDGGEISVIKGIGLSGSHISGDILCEKIPEFEPAELIDTLLGLITMGYVLCDKASLHSIEDVHHATFYVNSGYVKDLRDALDPRRRQRKKPSRRVRRE